MSPRGQSAAKTCSAEDCARRHSATARALQPGWTTQPRSKIRSVLAAGTRYGAHASHDSHGNRLLPSGSRGKLVSRPSLLR
eukprot:2168434-Prymnesium_polylepis.1